MTAQRCIRNPDDWTRFLAFIADWPMPYTVSVKQGAKRSLDQNALLHKWYGEVADHYSDLTMTEVKGICHREYGLAIRMRDSQWAWVWEKSGANLPYEKQCALLASGVMNVSSGMTTKELSEYMDAMSLRFLQEGVRLTDPEGVG